MQQRYIAPSVALDKLRCARSGRQPVYVYGATGYGKTELVQQYFSSRNYLYLSCADSSGELMQQLSALDGSPKKQAQQVIVLDDLQMLTDAALQAMVRNLLNAGQFWVILIGRSPHVRWMAKSFLEQNLMVITEADLHLSMCEIAEILKQHGVSATPEELQWLCEASEGNYLVVRSVAETLSHDPSHNQPIEQQLGQKIQDAFTEYLEYHVMAQWPQELLDFLMNVSVVDSFDKELAARLTEEENITRTLERLQELGNFITLSGKQYILRGPLLQAIRKRAEAQLGRQHRMHLLHTAGAYYEKQDALFQALNLYLQAGDMFYIRNLLMKNARKNPGTGFFYEMREYYFMFSEEECKEDVWLMSALAMIYSLSMQIPESEYWYQQLVDYKNRSNGMNRREAMERIIYLDIAMPHRGSKNILDILKKGILRMKSESLKLSEVSVTSNLPSLMNGGKDFCSWSRRDQELAWTVGPMITAFLGRHGKGLVNTSLAESFYEKGQEVNEVLSRLAVAKLESESGSGLEMEFVITGLIARCSILSGDINYARRILEGFYSKAVRAQQKKLLQNIEAMQCRQDLLLGDCRLVEKWMQTAPEENDTFFCMERYRYLTKIRCYLWKKEYTAAAMLIEKLQYYVTVCDRTYIGMELGILKAMLRHRQGMPWKEGFLTTLRELSSYHFVRILSEEGRAIYPLLEEIRKEVQEQDDIDQAWFEQVVRETRRMSLQYPLYLKAETETAPKISDIALQILRLQADGYSYTQISEQLSMKIATVKYHVMTTYRKLGVSNKTDAVLAAQSMHLL